MSERIGKRLKELRNKRGYSLRALGGELNIDYAYLSKIENNKSVPSIDMLEQIALFFNVDISYFFVDDALLGEFSQGEQQLLFEHELDIEMLLKKYNFKIDGKIATEDEIEEALKYIKALRIMEKNKNAQ